MFAVIAKFPVVIKCRVDRPQLTVSRPLRPRASNQQIYWEHAIDEAEAIFQDLARFHFLATASVPRVGILNHGNRE